MPEPDNNNIGIKSFWVSTAQTLGISTVVMCFLFYWAYQTITWEREQMIPCIQGNKEAINSNTETLRSVKTSIDRLDKTSKARLDQAESSQSK